MVLVETLFTDRMIVDCKSSNNIEKYKLFNKKNTITFLFLLRQ